jgi:hypothetical protein
MSQVDTQIHEEMNCVQDARIQAIESRLDLLPEIKQTMTNIEMAITGSRQLGLDGIIGRQEKQSTELEKAKSDIARINRMIYIGYGGIGVLSILWAVFKEFL